MSPLSTPQIRPKGSLWFRQALLADGWADQVRISVENGRIRAIERDVPAAETDARHDIALPGLPNLHSHAFQRAIAGLTEKPGPGEDSFWSWRTQMYRLLPQIGPDELQIIARLAYMEMLESGFTRVGEFHYLHHGPQGHAYDDPAEMCARLIGAAAESGIALTLLPVFYAHSGFGGAAPTAGQARFLQSPDSFAHLIAQCRSRIGQLPDAVLGLAPHSLRAVTAEELRAILPLAQGGPVHIHIAEQTREVEDCVAHTGLRPVEWLMAHAPVDAGWCLVHATHITPEERAAIIRSSAVAGLCPITEANLGDGLFPAVDFVAEGGRFGIGSDSNVLISATEELRLLEYPQRLHLRGRNLLHSQGRSTGRTLYEEAVTGGARALGVAIAGLAVGAVADIVAPDASHPSLYGKERDALLDSLVFAAAGQIIKTVWRGGVEYVREGRHIKRDQIVGDYNQMTRRLFAARAA